MAAEEGAVLAAQHWATNAALIQDCARLGYLRDDWLTLDPTYGEGKWWTLWRPDQLVCHDIDPAKGDGVDFSALPEADATYDAVAFDPPYVSVGGRETSGIKGMHAAYGMSMTARTPAALFEANQLGFAECVRVARPGAHLIFKSMDYITSGKLQPVTHWIINDALARGLIYQDRLEHVAKASGPQPGGREQQHARRNLSTMLVFKKKGRVR